MPAIARFSSFLLTCVMCLAPALAAANPPAPPAGDTLGATLAGEFALQAGRLDEAADWYLKAARSAEGDAGLAESATRIALLANDNTRSALALELWRTRAPSSLAMRAAEATLSLREDDARAARKQLESLLRDDNPDGWRYAVAALGSGAKDPKIAAKLLQQLLDDDAIPARLQPWLAFGGLAQRVGEPKLAEHMVDEVIARFPNEPRVALLRASQLREAGKTEQARQALAAMQATGTLVPELRMAIAAEYDALGDAKQAATVLAGGPQDDRSYRLRAALLAKVEDKTALLTLYDELKRDSAKPDPERRLLLGQTAEYLERYNEALAWYRGVAVGPARVQARLRAAKVLHDLKRADEAWRELHAMQADASIDEDARRDAYLLEASLHQEDKQDAAELDTYARGLSAYPDDPELLYGRALLWERRDDIARAEADLRRVLVTNPDSVAALNALGYTLADRTTRYAEALELIDRARVAEPDNPAIIDSYGWVLYRLGRNKEALVELRRAYALQKDAEIAAHIAEVLWMSGNKAEAREYFDASRKLDPDNRSLKRALARTGA